MGCVTCHGSVFYMHALVLMYYFVCIVVFGYYLSLSPPPPPPPPHTQAIALAKVLEGSAAQDDFTESLAGFYLLKYGTPQPKLSRQDSTIRNMKFQATMARQRKRLSGKKNSIPEGLFSVKLLLEVARIYFKQTAFDKPM